MERRLLDRVVGLVRLDRRGASRFLWEWKVDWKPRQPLPETDVPREQRRLTVKPKVPNPVLPTTGKWQYSRAQAMYHGPELLHTRLIHRQFGIQALESGDMRHGHFEAIRLNLNRKLDLKRMFAVWRVDGPWKAAYQRPPGLTLGGGKRDPKYYKTPVKDERIVLELGGNLDWQEAYRLLKQMAHYLPFRSRFVSQQMLDFERKVDKFVEERNVNPFNFDYVRQHNLCNVHRYMSPYTIKYGRRWW